MAKEKKKTSQVVKYNKWGYIFLIPFITVYLVFQMIPLVTTIYNSFFENYRAGLIQVGPNFVGIENYITIFSNGDIPTYFKTTIIMWIAGFIPQIVISLLLAAWFADTRLNIKAPGYASCIFNSSPYVIPNFSAPETLSTKSP